MRDNSCDFHKPIERRPKDNDSIREMRSYWEDEKIKRMLKLRYSLHPHLFCCVWAVCISALIS